MGLGNQHRSEGVVQSGTIQIDFTARGHGPALLLFHEGDEWPGLAEALAMHFRVITPKPPLASCESEFLERLGVLVDGLGLAQPGMVLVGCSGNFVEVARQEMDRLSAIEVITASGSREDIVALVERLAASVTPGR